MMIIPKTELKSLYGKSTPREGNKLAIDIRNPNNEEYETRKTISMPFTPNLSILSHNNSEVKSPTKYKMNDSKSSAFRYINSSNFKQFSEFISIQNSNKRCDLTKSLVLDQGHLDQIKMNKSMLYTLKHINAQLPTRTPQRKIKVVNKSMAIDDILELQMKIIP